MVGGTMTAPTDPQPTAPPSADLPKESPRTILFQFVFFPLGVVAVGVLVFLLFGKLASEEHSLPDYVNAIRAGSRSERGEAAFELAKSLKRGEAKRYPNLVQQVLDLYTQSKSDDPRIRRYLGVVLGNLHDPRATPVLIDALSDRDGETRIYALWALGEIRDVRAVPRMIVLLKDEDKDIRKMDAFALGEIGSAQALPALAEATSDPAADVRWNAAIALSRSNDSRSLGVLREMLDRSRLDRLPGLREDQKENAMITAMAPYARLAGAEARPVLQAIAERDPSLRVRSAAKSELQAMR
jgi:HEAT repeats